MAAGDVKATIRHADLAPLTPQTIQRKGSSAPLIDTGQMLQSITYEVRDAPDDLQLLPEGQRYLPSKKIMSQDALCVGDLVHYQDTTWRIVQLSDWSEYGYYRGIAVGHDGTAQPAAAAFGLT
ncbi:hypothetical protein AA93_07090 [Xylella fastidiosa subsp. pauca 11399]|nr:hypothetical protein AA93_07090 [Xylella fastidiosa subsp. pauca 11399]